MSVYIARAFTRSSVECIARVQPENAAFFMVAVVELSQGGCRLQTDRSLGPGTRIDLKLPDVPEVQAEVIWRTGHDVGCAFAQPINDTDVRHTVATSMI